MIFIDNQATWQVPKIFTPRTIMTKPKPAGIEDPAPKIKQGIN